MVYSQWCTEPVGSVEDAVALCSPLSSGFRAALGCCTGHGEVLCLPQTAPGSLLSLPLLSLFIES